MVFFVEIYKSFLGGKQIMNEKKSLTPKELTFCHQYIQTGNPAEAARISGYKGNLERKGTELISNPEIYQTIEKIFKEKKKNLTYKATTGYERLAFGSIADCIKLLFSEHLSPKDLERMDLFNISEIKKPKEGAMEIKFFDRLRALEKLEQIESEQKNDKEPFYAALEKGIQKLKKSNDINEDY